MSKRESLKDKMREAIENKFSIKPITVRWDFPWPALCSSTIYNLLRTSRQTIRMPALEDVTFISIGNVSETTWSIHVRGHITSSTGNKSFKPTSAKG